MTDRRHVVRTVVVLAVGVATGLAGQSCVFEGTRTIECDEGLRCPPGLACAAKQNVCISGTCANGQIDYIVGEVCDDGNLRDGDGCSGDCRVLETCGNGKLDAQEGCDWSAGMACSADCVSNLVCGNGFRDRHEVCDDGNTESGDGCSAGCNELEYCGDNLRDTGEECRPPFGDSSQGTADSDTCDSDCTLPLCGDGHLNTDAMVLGTGHQEVCDEGLMNSDMPNESCRLDCSERRCGDTVTDSQFGEQCDSGDLNSDGISDDSLACDSDCTAVMCGDGHVNMVIGETCDRGDPQDPGPLDADDCDSDCTAVMCGDGHPNTTAGEDCDTGADSAMCDSDCTAVMCGDNHVNSAAGEQCDDGNVANNDHCVGDCKDNMCGDGHWNEEEDPNGEKVEQCERRLEGPMGQPDYGCTQESPICFVGSGPCPTNANLAACGCCLAP